MCFGQATSLELTVEHILQQVQNYILPQPN